MLVLLAVAPPPPALVVGLSELRTSEPQATALASAARRKLVRSVEDFMGYSVGCRGVTRRRERHIAT
jgi:hypothetical protein